ncbi:MAG TPA: hypothetical protein VFQ43_03530 [Nitrososphaera sp.]|nr:hypothetical protein [Nitrososphaera sp.]
MPSGWNGQDMAVFPSGIFFFGRTFRGHTAIWIGRLGACIAVRLFLWSTSMGCLKTIARIYESYLSSIWYRGLVEAVPEFD